MRRRSREASETVFAQCPYWHEADHPVVAEDTEAVEIECSVCGEWTRINKEAL